MSGGSDTVTNTTSIPEWVRPYAENYMQRSQQTADLPYQPYGGQTVAQLNPYQTAGYQATANRAMQGSPVNDAASGELQKTLSGSYLGSNPYLQGQIDKASGDVTRHYSDVIAPQIDALDARSGSFGNSGVQNVLGQSRYQLGDTLANISTQMRGQDYGNERNRMQGAVGMAPTIANQDYVDANALTNAGAAVQGQEQANLSDASGRFQEAQAYPYKQLSTLGQGLGMNYGSTSTGTQPGANPFAQGAGAGLSLYSLSKMGGGGK